jgi:hypothetical protein
MLSLRPVQAMVLFVLVVLLICTVGSYANHHDIETNSDWWEAVDGEEVFWKVTTGRHSWDGCNTHSWHRVFIQNHSEHDLTVEYKYIHKVTNQANDTRGDDLDGDFSVAGGTVPVSGSREGWLMPEVSGWLEKGQTYKLQSQTKVKFTNDEGEKMEFRSTTMTTSFVY